MPQILAQRQLDHIKSEVTILSTVAHPFIVNMLGHLQDASKLYMLCEYVPGGELFSHLRREGQLTEAAARFYACEIVLAFEYLHSINVLYRDLKPENLLLTAKGHLKITDFGFAKVVHDRTYSLCGTPEYLAPEIIQSAGHGKGVDWWALGILLFEMLVGFPPFYADTPNGIYQKILAGAIDMPTCVCPFFTFASPCCALSPPRPPSPPPHPGSFPRTRKTSSGNCSPRTGLAGWAACGVAALM